MKSTAMALSLLCLGLLASLLAADDAGSVTVVGKDIVLSEFHRANFVKLVSGWHYRSEIYKYSAAPIAQFTHAGKTYTMHGNALTLKADKDVEHLWVGPYSQALILAMKESNYEIGLALAKMEGKDFATVLMDPPGAYPGGGPAPLLNQHQDAK